MSINARTLGMFPHVVTVYRNEKVLDTATGGPKTVFSMFVIEGVMLAAKDGEKQTKTIGAPGVVSSDNKSLLLLPYVSCAANCYAPKIGDKVKKGVYTEVADMGGVAALAGVFGVCAVNENDFGGLMAHWECELS